jgi:hypothetical protein
LYALSSRPARGSATSGRQGDLPAPISVSRVPLLCRKIALRQVKTYFA